MAESIFNWLVDTMARTDVIDLYFVVSDLIDIPQSEEQLAENAYYDAMAVAAAQDNQQYHNKPLDKCVFEETSSPSSGPSQDLNTFIRSQMAGIAVGAEARLSTFTPGAELSPDLAKVRSQVPEPLTRNCRHFSAPPRRETLSRRLAALPVL